MLTPGVDFDHVYAHAALMEDCNDDVMPSDFQPILQGAFGSDLDKLARVMKEKTIL